ncbi:hypothetical protein KL86DYS1_11023 [uncultured Dysgonomonas sp.]|uniref:Uncharacterized protein n=1 Tax=uncultured Dysgonomonas sp. TaxID=206096 RepID=A0A212J3Q9_9BACT|nr:hypothetical protein KL86DYS1_11023 [uncultured Dysgonomonas sp.]
MINQRLAFYSVLGAGLEPAQPNGHKILSLACLPFHHPSSLRAKDGIRTRDPDLGKVVLYQLSYFRIFTAWEILLNQLYGIHSHLASANVKNVSGSTKESVKNYG